MTFGPVGREYSATDAARDFTDWLNHCNRYTHREARGGNGDSYQNGEFRNVTPCSLIKSHRWRPGRFKKAKRLR
jgi:hypothetical protein